MQTQVGLQTHSGFSGDPGEDGAKGRFTLALYKSCGMRAWRACGRSRGMKELLTVYWVFLGVMMDGGQRVAGPQILLCGGLGGGWPQGS